MLYIYISCLFILIDIYFQNVNVTYLFISYLQLL